MTFGSNHRPFCATTWLASVAALMFLTSAATVTVRAETVQQAVLSDNATTGAAKSDGNKPDVIKSEDAATSSTAKSGPSETAVTGNANAQPANPAQPKSLTDRAIDKVKQVAKSAGDIFSR